MPDTALTWLDQVVANLTTGGNQFDPHILQLANGNIVVSWTTDNSSGPGAPFGLDVVGQIFDPLGNPVGSEISLNATFQIDNESDYDMQALPNGGFIAVYEDNDPDTGNVISLRVEVFDANGVSTSFNSFIDDLNNTNPNFGNPSIAVSSATSALIVYERSFSNTDMDIRGNIFNPATNTFGPDLFIFSSFANDTDVVVTTLSNGNYVVVATNDGTAAGTGTQIIMRIVDSDGNTVLGQTTVGDTGTDGFSDFNAHVASLSGGGYVVTWTENDGTDIDVRAQIFNADGTPVTSQFLVNGFTISGDNNNESNVVGLPDGGFIVFYDDDTSGENAGRGQRYDATGTPVGDEFTIDTSNAQDIDSVLLGDGRVAIVWADGEIQMRIIDTRDTINTGVYTPDQFQIGTVLNDVFTADSTSEFVFGWDGDDIITEAGQIREYHGGRGNDIINVTSGINSDLHDGGDDNDTIDWLASNVSGGTFDLQTGTASSGGSTEQMLNFENLNGTNNADIITGNFGNNILNGNGGSDQIFGGTGDDTIDGGSGSDIIQGGFGTDTVAGGSGNDTFAILTGEFSDDIDGGADTDLLVVNSRADFALTLDMNAGTYTLQGPQNTIVNVENVSGTQLGDSITGNGFANSFFGNGGNDSLFGDGGNDQLFGGADNDSLIGGQGVDRLDGGTGNDTMEGGLGNDRYIVDSVGDVIQGEIGFSLGGGIDTVESFISYTLTSNLEILRLQGTADINGTGGFAPEAIVGQAGNNVLDGGGGYDVITAKDGDDTLIGGLGADSLVGDGGADVFDFNNINESRPGQANRDFINGFVHGEDLIDLSGIDANTLTGANDAFDFIGSNAFSGTAGELRSFTFSGGNFNIVEADVDGDGIADMQIFVNLTNTMTSDDFIL